MFMTDPDLIYGKNSGQPSVYTGSIKNIEAQEESKKSSEIMKKTGAATVATAKLTGKATIGAAKTAGNVAAKLTKNAADYLKSDDAAEKMNFLKGKAKSAASGAGSMLSGIRSKASGMISEQRNRSNDEYTDTDNIENIANAENIYDDDSAESTYSDQQDSCVSDTNYDENIVHHEEDVSEYENSQITENQDTNSVVSSRQGFPPEIKTSPNIPQSTPNPVSFGTPGYVIQKQKSNTVLIIVIIVLVLIIGILGGMFFMMSRDKKQDKPNQNASVSDSEESKTNEEAATKTEIITESVTTETSDAVVTTEPKGITANNENSYYANYNAPQTGDKIIEMNIRNYGTVKFRLFPEYTENGVENFIKLTEKGYYDGLTFHRVINDFMIQGGDPLGTGYGGESIWGGMFNAGTDPHLLHLPGAVAYANAGSLDTSNSQFYIVTGDQNITEDTILQYEKSGYQFSDEQENMYIENGGIPYLDGNYTIFGQVFEGLDIVFMIQECSTDSNDKPLDDIIIDSVKVTEYNGETLKWHISDYDFKSGIRGNIGNNNDYTTYDTSAATPDFKFFDQPALGIIITQSDPLNLRSKPSTDGKIIIKMAQNAYCSIYGQNADWCYVSYTEDGITYYGYANRQFIGDGAI